MIYFIRAAELNAVKIGHTDATTADGRKADLQTGYPGTLEILATMPGDKQTERELHERFADLRICGEWFRNVDGLLALINGVKDARGKPDEYGDRAWRYFALETPEYLFAKVAETAYRRGFQQAIDTLAEIIRDNRALASSACHFAAQVACMMRFDDKAYPHYSAEFDRAVRTAVDVHNPKRGG